MSTVVALGETHELEGFVLVGATVMAAATPEAVVDAWHNLGRDVGMVILSPTAAETLRPSLADRPDVLTVVMP